MSASESFQVTIPSDIAEGQAIQERIVSMLEERDYTMRDVFGVKLALEEAIVNAIKHGNKYATDKQVHIDWEIDDDAVRIQIEDEGPGFDPSDIPDPTLLENLERPSGRGIMLIRAYMTSCEYEDRGRRVVMEKQRSTEPAE
ncbi:Serine/threonine-protein kinase BtrW [Polystyrenella longa]|uniref:Serine/threonine-protein kinase BtrW n=1 Tax=Polystyrenella longa TaxID=2528007 RepID=A0A518CN42_9PLAN|nr:ATP-binding protein [Polystyrenella longa]QDU80638.1 Serine/threonine-protein kinase BtrW [Polystyrenella longa]